MLPRVDAEEVGSNFDYKDSGSRPIIELSQKVKEKLRAQAEKATVDDDENSEETSDENDVYICMTYFIRWYFKGSTWQFSHVHVASAISSVRSSLIFPKIQNPILKNPISTRVVLTAPGKLLLPRTLSSTMLVYFLF